MAATVRITCERCGDVELPIGEVCLGVPGHEQDTFVEFACVRCGTRQRQPVNARGTMFLLRAGVQLTADAGTLPYDALPSSSDESR